MNENTIIYQHTLQLAENEELVKRKKHTTAIPNYYRVGNGTMNKHGIQSINLVKEVTQLTKPAQYLINWIMDGMVFDPTLNSIAFVVRVVPDTPADKQVVKKAYPELFKKDLVRRVKRGYYMINPNAIITDRNAQLSVWNSL